MFNTFLSDMSIAYAAAPTMVPMAQCVPTNQLLINPVKPVIDTVVGAIGGVFFGIVIVFLVISAVMALATILNKNSSNHMKNMAKAAGIPIVLILIIIAYNAIVVGMNNVC